MENQQIVKTIMSPRNRIHPSNAKKLYFHEKITLFNNRTERSSVGIILFSIQIISLFKYS